VGALVYWQFPHRWRAVYLSGLSFVLLATIALETLLGLAVVALAVYLTGRRYRLQPEKGGHLLVSLIVVVIGILCFFKYIPGVVRGVLGDASPQFLLIVAIPLGISYSSFKLIHYLIEVHRGNIRQHTLFEFTCYMFLFPIFTAGPIERFDHFLENREERWSWNSTVEGLTRIIHGLVKKFVLVAFLDHHALSRMTPAEIQQRPFDFPAPLMWAFLCCWYLYVYLDFSAYSDIAIGASRLFGLRIMENFNFPLLARNIQDFWKRWHMSLGNWCHNYVYMPTIGRWRNPYLAVYAALIVFALWHSGTMTRLCWGLYHATAVALYAAVIRWRRRRGWRPGNRLWSELPDRVYAQLVLVTSMAFPVAEQAGGLMGAGRILGMLFSIRI
jgi:alginate O-acetyltransferase complex protein AlgI